MKKWFAFGVIGLVILEAASVYFIMPMPGSQRMRSIDLAYALHRWRWVGRVVLGGLLLASLPSVWRAGGWRRWAVLPSLALVGLVACMTNFVMKADRMFLQPKNLLMAPVAGNTVANDRLVVGISVNGEARAYPLQFIGYHHQVRDSIRGEPVLVSYCTVCRTGRVFDPVIDGKAETFRLVGMDHFNAMLEDRSTGSWWRQANGEAVAGPLAGKMLKELPSQQVTLEQWLAMHPETLIMQPDPDFVDDYAQDLAYERGTSRSALTGTDPASWGEKSWVVGIALNGESKAYDWNDLVQRRVINDVVGGRPIVLALAPDRVSFFAFERPGPEVVFELNGESLVGPGGPYALNGKGPSGRLNPVQASQEFWHSWRTFHPGTERY